MIDKLNNTIKFIREQTDHVPEFGIVLGTGLGGLAKEINVECAISYEEIPSFPVSTVESHSGKLIFGELGGRRVVAMQGRFHYYEGYSMQEVTYPIRVLKLLGIEKLFISNASGGLNPDYAVSELMVVEDHINLFPEHPLRGKNFDDLGPRFPDMSEPYDMSLIKLAEEIAEDMGITLRKGVYAGIQGPTLETKSEYRYLRTIGADAVGMSTVPENIVARHMEIPTCAISVITDMGIPEILKKVTVEEVIAAAMKVEPHLTELMTKLISRQERN